jgi:protein required for attachment to host cells
MLDVKLDRGAWVVVCDGAKAIILENVGSRVAPSLKTREVYQQDDPMTQELGTDEPGRAFQSVGNRRSAMEQTDWHQQNEQRFLARLAGRLDRAVQGGVAKAMIVTRRRARLACCARNFPRMSRMRCTPRSTRISSSCRSIRSRSTSSAERTGRTESG